MRAAGASSVDAGQALMIDGDAIVAAADEAGIATWAMNRVRVGVIGVGHLGQHHARLLAAIDTAELVGICDTNRDRAAQIAGTFGGRCVDDPQAAVDGGRRHDRGAAWRCRSSTPASRSSADGISGRCRPLDSRGRRAICSRSVTPNGSIRGGSGHAAGNFIETGWGRFGRNLDIDVIFDVMIRDSSDPRWSGRVCRSNVGVHVC
jgi:hypothetical protein